MSQEVTGPQGNPELTQQTAELQSVDAEESAVTDVAEQGDAPSQQLGVVERAKNAALVGIANFGEGVGKVGAQLENLNRKGGVVAVGARAVAFGLVVATQLPVARALGLGDHLADGTLDALQDVGSGVDHDSGSGSGLGSETPVQLNDAELASSSSPLGEQVSENAKADRTATVVIENGAGEKDDVKVKVNVPAGFEVTYDKDEEVFEVTTNTGEKVTLPKSAIDSNGRLEINDQVNFEAANGLSLDQKHSDKKHTLEIRDGFKETDKQEAKLTSINEALERKYEGVSVTVDEKGYHVHVLVEGHKYPSTFDLKGLKLHLDPENGTNLEWLQQQLAEPLAEQGLELSGQEDGKIIVVEKDREWIGAEEEALLLKVGAAALAGGVLYKGVPLIRRQFTRRNKHHVDARTAWEVKVKNKVRKGALQLVYINPNTRIDEAGAKAIERLRDDFLSELQNRLLVRLPRSIREDRALKPAEKAAHLNSKQVEKAFTSLTKEWEKVHKGIQPIRVQAGIHEALSELGVDTRSVYKLNRKGVIIGVKSTKRLTWADDLRSNLK